MSRISTIFLVCLGVIVATSGKATIDSLLTSKFFEGGGAGESVMVSFTQSMDSVFSEIDRMNFTSDTERRQTLTELQEAFTNVSQAPLKGFLETQGVTFESFWINNKMVIPNAGPGLVNAISNIPGVSRIEPEPQATLFPAFDPAQMKIEELNLTRQTRQSNPEWGIRAIRADRVWSSYKGRGVVVAIIDTGVRGTHESIKSNFRSDYGWFDPYSSTASPNDQNGHGTHVTGTICGKNGIGVAPDATWISCMGCTDKTCGGSELIRCGQWVQCPTRPDGSARNCDMAPKVVSNSWGSKNSQGSTWYDDVIRSWHASGIIPVFSMSNYGPDCNTGGNPGDRPNVIAVGNIDSNRRIARSSSRGPTRDDRVKPDISAPGSQIRSASHTSDNSYATLSGTSMACPHVSGVVALMYSKNGGLNYDQVYRAITNSANRNLRTGSAQSCGGVASNAWPNNAFGYGLIDAPNSVNAV